MVPNDDLKLILQASGMTQGAFARRMGVSLVTVNAWMNGRAIPRSKHSPVIDAIWAELAAGTTLTAVELRDLAARDGAKAAEVTQSLTAQQTQDLLHGLGDSGAIEVLRQGQYTSFLKTVASIIKFVPAGAMAEAALLLNTAKQRDRQVCDEVLTYPLIGLWAAKCLQELYRNDADDAVVKQHVEHFGSVAAVAAWKSGVTDFEISLPVWNSAVILPSLGRALLFHESDQQCVRLVCVDGRLTIIANEQSIDIPNDPSKETADWQPIRSISVDTDGLQLTLAIDDIDPFGAENTLGDVAVPSPRLEQVDYKNWKIQLAEAWELLVHRHRRYAEGVASAARVIVPISHQLYHVNSSYRGGFGAIGSTIGESPIWIAHSMLEDVQHMKLNAIDTIDALHTESSDSPTYFNPSSPQPQSFNCVLEGLYGANAVAELWAEHYQYAFGEEQFDSAYHFYRANASREWLSRTLEQSGELTALGRQLLSIVKLQKPHITESVPEILDLVRDTTVDRWLNFRLSYVVSDEEDIERLALAWVSGLSCSSDLHIRQRIDSSGTDSLGQKLRQQLSLIKLNHPKNFEDALHNENYLELIAPGATSADAHAVAGQFEEAQQKYVAALAEKPGDVETWGGLAAASAWAGGEASSTLGRFPEVVAVLHAYLLVHYNHFENPLRLAKWLEPVLTQMNEHDFTSLYVHSGEEAVNAV